MVIMKTKKPKKLLEELHSDAEECESREEIPKEILVIAQEVKIVQALACNDLNKRNRQLKKLRKWLLLRARSSFAFSEEDFLRIWKGLYYNMWMSDKPLVQEELAEQLGQLLECFGGDVEISVNFFGAFLHTMCQQWFGIDQWRIDKFLMLVRRMLRYMFRVLKGSDWSLESVRSFNKHMQITVLAEQSAATGLTMHFLDIFFEELAKVSEGEISAEQVGEFVRPFVTFLATQRDFKLLFHCRTRVFFHLLYQSTLGREYSEKYNAWKEMGFPTASIDDLEKEENGDTATEDEAREEKDREAKPQYLDPRAGNVDVFMPELPLDGKYVIEELEKCIYKRDNNTKTRKMLKKMLGLFQTYNRGEFPLGVKTMPRYELKSEKPLINDKIVQLENLENEMYSTGRKLKQLNKRKRRKLLKSINYDNLDETNFEQMIEKAIPKQYLKESKKKVKGSMMGGGWLEEVIDEAEATTPKKKRKTKPEEPEEKEEDKQTATVTKQKAKKLVATEGEPVKKMKKVERPAAKQTPETAANIETVKEVAEAENTKDTNSRTPTTAKKTIIATSDEWNSPLGEGEVEYFIPSRKLLVKKANVGLVRNPLAKKSSLSTPKNQKPSSVPAANTPKTPASVKRVKIALKHNTAQNPSEYIKQIKSSPNVPYDADKKPGKGLLKPNSMPSPINPFYKKKIGLRLLNDTL